MTLHDINIGDSFSFPHSDLKFVFGGIDGSSAKVFDSVRDLKNNHNPAFLSARTRIGKVHNDSSGLE